MATIAERVAVNENRFITIDKKLDQVIFKVDNIHDQMPEIIRKVNAHHKVFHEHVEQLRALKSGNPFATHGPRPSDGNGGYIERRAKKSFRKQFKESPINKKITIILAIVTFLFAYGGWLLEKMHMLLNWIETILK